MNKQTEEAMRKAIKQSNKDQKELVDKHDNLDDLCGLIVNLVSSRKMPEAWHNTKTEVFNKLYPCIKSLLKTQEEEHRKELEGLRDKCVGEFSDSSNETITIGYNKKRHEIIEIFNKLIK